MWSEDASGYKEVEARKDKFPKKSIWKAIWWFHFNFRVFFEIYFHSQTLFGHVLDKGPLHHVLRTFIIFNIIWDSKKKNRFSKTFS